MILRALIIIPIGIIPSSRYNAFVGVVGGTFNIFLAVFDLILRVAAVSISTTNTNTTTTTTYISVTWLLVHYSVLYLYNNVSATGYDARHTAHVIQQLLICT